MRYVKQVLRCLFKNRLFVKGGRCEFHVDTVSFLGYIIEKESLKLAVVNWPKPTHGKQLQCFLGFSNFYRQFIWDFSKIDFTFNFSQGSVSVESTCPSHFCPPQGMFHLGSNLASTGPEAPIHRWGGCLRLWGGGCSFSAKGQLLCMLWCSEWCAGEEVHPLTTTRFCVWLQFNTIIPQHLLAWTLPLQLDPGIFWLDLSWRSN